MAYCEICDRDTDLPVALEVVTQQTRHEPATQAPVCDWCRAERDRDRRDEAEAKRLRERDRMLHERFE